MKKDINDEIKSYINNSNNLIIFSEDNISQLPLIEEVLNDIKDSTICIFADFSDVVTKWEFSNVLLQALLKTLDLEFEEALNIVIKEHSFVKKTLNNVENKISSYQDNLGLFFGILLYFSQNKKAVLVLNEFDRVLKIKDARIDASLRKHMQEPHDISYFFSSSNYKDLLMMFRYQDPLYEMATPFCIKKD